VFAIPGSIHSPQARGCHALLKQGAKLVETAQDVLEELAPSALRTGSSVRIAPDDARQRRASSTRCSKRWASTRSASTRWSRAPASRVHAAGQLLEHELAGRVARLPGGLYQRIAST
jgi:DNA processing protein